MAIPRRRRGSIDKELEPFQFGLDGKLVTSVDPTRILTVSDSGETRQDNFKSLKNIRYTDNGIRGVRGMTKINSTALSSHPKVRNIHHFSKSQPAESHVLVHAFNSGLTQSKVFKNDTAIPNTGDFSGTALHTDASGSGKGRFENAQLGRMLYCNGVETMIWGGDESRLSKFVIFDPNGTFLYDYTEKVQNTLTDADNVATLKRVSGVGSETKLLLHCDGSDASTTITDNSPVSPHTVTAVGNAQIDTAIKKFGTGGLLLDGTGDWATIPDDSDFVLSGGVWTFECWAKVSLAADSGLYAQAKSSATQDYMWIYIDTDGAVNLVINEATDAATGTVTLDTGASGSVDGITVNSVQVMSGAESFDTDLNTTATAVAANITAHTSSPNYTAAAVGATITITSVIKGADVNGFAVASSCTTITSTDVNMASGASSNEVLLSTPDSVITASTFAHIRVVENSNNFYIFVNGIQKAFTNNTNRTEGAIAYNSTIFIGAVHDGTTTSKPLNGTLDEIRLTNSALSVTNFDVPAAAYTAATTNVNMRVGNILPIEGVRFTISNANTSAGTLSVYYFSSTGEWTAVTNLTDNTASAGVPLAQTGTVTFDSTAGVAIQHVIDGILGYWYKIEITNADTATAISSVTVKEPFQDIQDFWDGDFRTIASVQLFEDDIEKDNTVNVFEDDYLFDEVTDGDMSSYMIMSSLTATAEYLMIGFLERQQGMRIKMIPDRANQSTSATGKVAFGDDVAVNDTITGITVNSVEIMSGTVTAGSGSSTLLATDVAASINNKTSIPNYTAEEEDASVIITSVTTGTSVNGFTVTSSGSGITTTDTNMASARDITAVLTVSYWNGAEWISVGSIQDGTISNNSSFGKSGFITWGPLGENVEFRREVSKEEPFYYYKLEWSENFADDVLCYFVSGIPVQKQIEKYNFALNAQNRTWLFSNQSDTKNTARVSALGTLNAFNGIDSRTFRFGDETEVLAAVEIFTKLTTGGESDILIAKNNSMFLLTGTNPNSWTVTQISDDVGCPAPYTFKASPIGLEFAQLQSKQVVVWQSENGIMLYDSTAIFPISDTISNYFDQSKSESINLDKIAEGYGFWDNSSGVYEYHWLFASGNSTTINKELVFDLRRQKWWEADRESANLLQCGTKVVDTNGAHYNYAMIDSGYMERLENGTAWTGDGSSIAYEFELGDLLFDGNLGVETLIRYIRLVMKTKSSTPNSVTIAHYGDTNQTPKTITLSPAKSGYDATMPIHSIAGSQWGRSVFHRLKFTISTNNETIGFEPLWVSGFYEEERLRLKD